MSRGPRTRDALGCVFLRLRAGSGDGKSNAAGAGGPGSSGSLPPSSPAPHVESISTRYALPECSNERLAGRPCYSIDTHNRLQRRTAERTSKEATLSSCPGFLSLAAGALRPATHRGAGVVVETRRLTAWLCHLHRRTRFWPE